MDLVTTKIRKVHFCNGDLLECISYLREIYGKEMKLNNYREIFIQ